MVSNPVLVEVIRGDIVECAHRGRVAVVRGNDLVMALGDIFLPTYPRSAVKIIQALPVVLSGAAERFGFSDEELAFCCASHLGESRHVACAGSMLASLSLGEADLRCGVHKPMGSDSRDALMAAHERATQLHNNCSGKHAGMLASTRQLGFDKESYCEWDHPLQAMIRDHFSELSGCDCHQAPFARDGCSVPTYALPVEAIARAFSLIADPEGISADKKEAIIRFRKAAAFAPDFVEGARGFSSHVMRQLGQRAFVKGGAEGYYVASLPEQGLGIALKIDDGHKRASEAVMATLLAHYLSLKGEEARALVAPALKTLSNFRGFDFGLIRPSEHLKAALA